MGMGSGQNRMATDIEFKYLRLKTMRGVIMMFWSMQKSLSQFLAACFIIFASSGCATTADREDFTGAIVLAGATIIDGTGAAPMPDMTLVIRDGRIDSIQPANGKNFGGADIIDVTGKYIIPGLIEAHIHLTAPQSPDMTKALPALLKSGVTSVRNMGGNLPRLNALEAEIDNGSLEGPRIVMAANFFGASFMNDPRTLQPGYERGQSPSVRFADDTSDAAQLIIDAKEAGADGIKFYSGLDATVMAKLADQAKTQGLEVWSHAVVWPMRPSVVVSLGVDSISHAHGLAGETDEPLPGGIAEAISQWLPKQDFAAIDVYADRYKTLFADMAARGQILEPTLHALRRSPGAGSQTRQKPSGRPAIDFPAFIKFSCDVTRAAHEAGVPIAAGTDTFGDMLVHVEIKHLTDCGLSPLEAIRSATLVNAKVIGREIEIGSIEEGKRADLIVLDENPVDNLDYLETIHAVYKSGRLVERQPDL